MPGLKMNPKRKIWFLRLVFCNSVEYSPWSPPSRYLEGRMVKIFHKENVLIHLKKQKTFVKVGALPLLLSGRKCEFYKDVTSKFHAWTIFSHMGFWRKTPPKSTFSVILLFFPRIAHVTWSCCTKCLAIFTCSSVR